MFTTRFRRSLIILFLALISAATAGAQTTAPVNLTKCNSVAFAQLPGNNEYFLGRQLINDTNGDGCAGTSWNLALYSMNWSTNVLTFDRYVLQPTVLVDGASLESAYDPTAAIIDNETWVAFECAGRYGRWKPHPRRPASHP